MDSDGKPHHLLSSVDARSVINACMGGAGAGHGEDGTEAFASVTAASLSGHRRSYFDTVLFE